MEMVPIDCQGSLRQRALDEYAVSLKLLDAVKSRTKLREEWVLSILMARDEVQRSMTTTEGQERSVAEMRRLIELDDRLRKGAGRMARVVRTRELERWRSDCIADRVSFCQRRHPTMNSLSRNQIETLIQSNADDLQIAKTIAIQSKPDQTKTLVGGVLLALLANVVSPGVGPLVVLALTADKFMEQRKRAKEVTHKIERGEVWDFIPESDRAHFSALNPETTTTTASTELKSAQPQLFAQIGQDQDERSLFAHFADNPFLCYFILASQRTGKTSSAAAASLVIKREKGTEVYYINLSDHGQGNREAFAHADRAAIGDINGGNPADAVALVKEAVSIIEQFHQSNNAILVVDEWVNLALKVRSGMDDFCAVLSPKAAALTSNGIGCGRYRANVPSRRHA